MEINNNVMNSVQTPVPAIRQEGWSWGGCMLAVVLIIASKRYIYLLLYLLMFIPLVNLIAMIGIPIWMGVKGRSLVVTSPAFANHDEATGFMKGIDHAGKIMFFIMIIFIVLGIVMGAALTALIPANFRELGSGLMF